MEFFEECSRRRRQADVDPRLRAHGFIASSRPVPAIHLRATGAIEDF